MATMNLEISNELKTKLEEKIKETEFNSVDEYINYILEQVTSDTNSSDNEEAYSKDEETAMKQRLEELGYV
jgi:Arc/MetJ-type ribon-helix-helix transcriptional regulator